MHNELCRDALPRYWSCRVLTRRRHGRVSSEHVNILLIWAHGDLRLTDGSAPGRRRDSSDDIMAPGYCRRICHAIPGECRAPPALSTNKYGRTEKWGKGIRNTNHAFFFRGFSMFHFGTYCRGWETCWQQIGKKGNTRFQPPQSYGFGVRRRLAGNECAGSSCLIQGHRNAQAQRF